MRTTTSGGVGKSINTRVLGFSQEGGGEKKKKPKLHLRKKAKTLGEEGSWLEDKSHAYNASGHGGGGWGGSLLKLGSEH